MDDLPGRLLGQRLIKLYHCKGTRSIRIYWLLEELGIPFELCEMQMRITGRTHTQPVPGGKFPAIEDGNVVMSESGAIVEYILDRYGEGRLQPARESAQWGEFLQWLHFAEGTAFPNLQNVAFHSHQLPPDKRVQAVIDLEMPFVEGMLDRVNQALAGRSYLLGAEFSAADIMLGFSLFLAKRLRLLGPYPNIAGWLERLEARPALQKAAS